MIHPWKDRKLISPNVNIRNPYNQNYSTLFSDGS